MNRQKKIKQITKKLLKKENAKKASKNKPVYVCKADREALKAQELAAEQESLHQQDSHQTSGEAD